MARWWLLALGFAGWVVCGLTVCPPGDAAAVAPGNDGHRAERIVSLAPNLTEILFALGAGDRVVAVTNHCNYPSSARAKARVGTFWQPNLEAIIGARPDLVVALDMAQHGLVAQRLARMGYRCLVLDIDTVAQLMEVIETLGHTLGCPDKADSLRASLAQRLAKACLPVGMACLPSDRAGQTAGPRPRVLWVVQRQPLRVAGQQTFVNEMIELAGGQNAMGATIYQYPPIGAEQVLACRAEVIIEPVAAEDLQGMDRRRAIEFWNLFQGVPAVANQRIYFIDADIVSRLGPRLADGVEAMAGCLRPEGRED